MYMFMHNYSNNISLNINNIFSLGLKDFLHESAIELQKVFDSACGFRYTNECMTDEVEHIINEVSSMKVLAIELCSATSCTYSITKGMLCHNLLAMCTIMLIMCLSVCTKIARSRDLGI